MVTLYVFMSEGRCTNTERAGGGEVGQIQDTCKIMTRHEIYDVMAGAAYLTKFAGLIGGLSLTGLNVASLNGIPCKQRARRAKRG